MLARGEPVLEVDVAVVEAADGGDFAARRRSQYSRMNWAIGHGSSGGRFGAQVREVADQHADQFALAVPEAGEQFALFFGRQQVGREAW